MSGPLSGHGERQLVPLPSTRPPASSQGSHGSHVSSNRHVQEDAGVGRGRHHSVFGPGHHTAHRPARGFGPQLHLLVLERLLLLNTVGKPQRHTLLLQRRRARVVFRYVNSKKYLKPVELTVVQKLTNKSNKKWENTNTIKQYT